MESLVVSNLARGINQRYPPFLLNNQTFEVLTNLSIYRASILKKPAPTLLDFLTQTWTVPGGTWTGVIATNLDSINPVTVPSGYSIVPESVTISIAGPPYTITDNGEGGFVLNGNPIAGSINYASGIIVGVNPGTTPDSSAITYTYSIEPHLPVMGIEPYRLAEDYNFPIQLYFDQKWCYLWTQSSNFIFNSYYKANPAPGAIVEWSGTNSQQFQSQTYSGAVFVTNGVPGFHMFAISGITQANPAVVTTSVAHGLPISSTVEVWFNDLTRSGGGLGASWLANVNQHTFLATVTGTNTLTIPIDTTGGGYTGVPTNGAMQLLTASRIGDGIRWYDNENRNGVANGRGFVNFAPPLDDSADPRYLVGCDGIFTFKDHLLVWGTYERKLGDASATYYPYRIAWSQLGNPYYALTPVPSQYTEGLADAWNQFPGFGGNIPINNQEKVISCTALEDLVLMECEASKRKLFYNDNEFDPFQIQGIDWEYGADTPSAAVKLNQQIISMTQRGITGTNSTSTERIDDDLPDQIYRLKGSSSGAERVSAIRDYKNEFIYFAYPDVADGNTVFPTRFVVYNYYDKVFSIYIENVTTCGYYQREEGFTWDTVPFETWEDWDTSWDYYQDNEKFPFVSFGNPQGAVFYYSGGCEPDPIFYSTTFSSVVDNKATVVSPNHPFNSGSFISFANMPGLTIPEDAVYQIIFAQADSFVIAIPDDKMITGTYLGGGTFARMENFFFRTAQFNPYQQQGASVLLGPTKILCDKTDSGAFSLDLITDFDAGPSNSGATRPFSLQGRVVSTTRSGNTIFQQAAASQIWQRLVVSGSGMTVQLRGTMNTDQMLSKPTCSAPFRLYTIVVQISPGRMSS
jgi:hypothetical protein